MKKYIMEFIGTYFLVFTIGLATNSYLQNTEWAPLAIGCVLMIMVYMGGHISGAHYNPAVTFAVWWRKKMEMNEALMYMLVQIIGATLAAMTYYLLFRLTFAPAPTPYGMINIDGIRILKPLFIEFIFTFALASVVLNVATTQKTSGNSFYGLAIGFTIFVAAMVGGPISGGAFNPAVGIGPILIDTIFGNGDSVTNLWLYIVGPFLGGAVAAIVYKITNPEEFA